MEQTIDPTPVYRNKLTLMRSHGYRILLEADPRTGSRTLLSMGVQEQPGDVLIITVAALKREWENELYKSGVIMNRIRIDTLAGVRKVVDSLHGALLIVEIGDCGPVGQEILWKLIPQYTTCWVRDLRQTQSVKRMLYELGFVPVKMEGHEFMSLVRLKEVAKDVMTSEVSRPQIVPAGTEPMMEGEVYQYTTYHDHNTMTPGWQPWTTCDRIKFAQIRVFQAEGFPYRTRILYTEENLNLITRQDFVSALTKLTDEQRLDVFREFCVHCGTVRGGQPCHCTNDE